MELRALVIGHNSSSQGSLKTISIATYQDTTLFSTAQEESQSNVALRQGTQWTSLAAASWSSAPPQSHFVNLRRTDNNELSLKPLQRIQGAPLFLNNPYHTAIGPVQPCQPTKTSPESLRALSPPAMSHSANPFDSPHTALPLPSPPTPTPPPAVIE